MTIYFFGTLALIAVLLTAVWYFWHPKWQGFQDKTLWDWINILATPFVLGSATFVFTASQKATEMDRASEVALQGYFARIGDLVLDERLVTRPEQIAALGRAETAAILHLVDGERAGRVLAFLDEMSLLQTFSFEFEGFDLSGGEMKGVNLSGLDFEDSNLSGADLDDAIMSDVDFENADLRRADMSNVDLRRSDFSGAMMKGADLVGADLRGANLNTAIGLTEDQLENACMDENTILPGDQKRYLGETEACGKEFDD